MTAYSFGARWVGIVAFRDSPENAPEPLHKMALRLRRESESRAVQIDGSRSMPAAALLNALVRIRVRRAVAGEEAKARECLKAEQAIRSGLSPSFRPWLSESLLVGAERHDSVRRAKGVSERVGGATQTQRRDLQDVRIVATGWASAYPQAPDSAWLPPLRSGAMQALRRQGIDLDDGAQLWLRWACLHSSYLYESVPDSPLSAGTLDVLGMLGRCWVRIALLDRVRAMRGDFASNNEVSEILSQDQAVRAALGTWVRDLGAAWYGKGERSLQSSGQRSSAPEAVAMQIAGALSLVTASQAPADAMLEAVAFQPSRPEPDWQSLLVSHLKREPNFTRSDSGPDHRKTFTVTVEANGRAASATAASAKAARRTACRAFVHQYLPHMLPRGEPAKRTPWPGPKVYSSESAGHSQARGWIQRAFELADGGLVSEALSHRSWTYENQRLVAMANQRDCGTLATEGSEILTTLVRHQYALRTLNNTFLTPSNAVVSPSVTQATVGDLFDSMPIAGGVLRSSGTSLSAELKEDVAQAIAGASWRANGDLLAERQNALLARWVRSFTPPRDAATQLQEYCAKAKVPYSTEYEERGADHAKEYIATLTFEVGNRSTWRGDWEAGKTAAKQVAAGSVLDFLLGHGGGDRQVDPEQEKSVLRDLLLAELRAIDPARISHQREVAAGRLGVDWLVSGAFADYSRWAETRAALFSGEQPALMSRLQSYYDVVITQNRREGVRRWVARHTPTRGGDGVQPEELALAKSCPDGVDAARLALLAELLGVVEDHADPVEAILSFVASKAEVVADAAGERLELDRSEAEGVRTVAVRVSGADISRTIDPVIQVVDAVWGGALWNRDSAGVALSLPALPTARDTLSEAGIGAVARALADPWLRQVRRSLSSFLAVVERLSSDGSDLTADERDDLALAELSMMLVLRSSHEEDI